MKMIIEYFQQVASSNISRFAANSQLFVNSIAVSLPEPPFL
jgi:hypothetical protein